MSIKVFPIGYVAATTDSRGSFSDGGTPVNRFFEPNVGCTSEIIDTTLISQFDSHAIQTRKKIPTYRSIMYDFEGIWNREYIMIERFYNMVDGRAGRFYIIDFSKTEKLTNYSTSAGECVVTLPNTARFNTIAGRYGYWVAVWKPQTASLMMGKIVRINTDASIVITASYGDLTAFNGNLYAYPMCECLFSDSLSNFKQGGYNPETGNDGGFMYSGNIKVTQYGAG